MNTKITYTAVELKLLRHEYKVPVDESPFLTYFHPSSHCNPHYMYPDLFPPGSRIIKLKPGQCLPKGSVPLPFPIEERNRYRDHGRKSPSPLPGDSNYQYKYTEFFEPYMRKPQGASSKEQSSADMVSESSSDSIQFQLPPQ
ncbi:hypothetical protein C7M61_000126 [Candidozyma pseudohaemuli]|uniref:Uncharacterized protein n=1 Tax=Candidozyma pseudohaemuli TaxID=418784 RepID=A0A2P7YWY8_9ASCO|nr:hypothetical protein C7M61_000126 [[Candida] pseudohaemulonii]PSK40483.1 hypothetical protein C7M61_000126 [[Candida] pseudohaemulonii]